MIIDCISDLHGHYPKLEGGDLLIVAGDLTARDTVIQHFQFQAWLHEQNYRKKIVIAGNHDNRLAQLPFESIKRQYEELDEDYLCDSGTEFEGLKIWGSPWTKTFKGMNPHCKAFTVDTEEELASKFSLIPDDTDILITHSPPYGIHDINDKKIKCGSKTLREILFIKKPRLHVFGHIHECGYKFTKIKYPVKIDQISNDMIQLDIKETHCINASHVNEHYEPVNKPIRVIL